MGVVICETTFNFFGLINFPSCVKSHHFNCEKWKTCFIQSHFSGIKSWCFMAILVPNCYSWMALAATIICQHDCCSKAEISGEWDRSRICPKIINLKKRSHYLKYHRDHGDFEVRTLGEVRSPCAHHYIRGHNHTVLTSCAMGRRQDVLSGYQSSPTYKSFL